MDRDTFRQGETPTSQNSAKPYQGAFTPVSDISPEAYVFLAAAEAAAARRAEALDAEVMEIDAKWRSVFHGSHDPARVSPSSLNPPKRFYRIFWQSVSTRLLHRWAQDQP